MSELMEQDAMSAARAWQERYQRLVEVSGQLAYEHRMGSGDVLWSDNAVQLLGYGPEEMAGGIEQWYARIHPQDRDQVQHSLQEAGRRRENYQLDYRCLHSNGHYRWLRDRGGFLADEVDGQPVRIGLLQDITGFRELEHLVQRQSRLDARTGAFNRQHFLSVAEQEIARAQRYQHKLALLMIDIDRFKEINDSLGQAAGDLTLQWLAEVCWENLRHIDAVARLEADQFAVLLPETGPAAALKVAERLRAAAERSVLPLGAEVLLRFTVSMGLASFRNDGDVQALMKRAEFAMYQARCSGGNRVCTG